MPPRRPGFRYPRGIADLFGQPPRARPSGLVIPPVVPAQIRGAYAPDKMGWGPQVRPIARPDIGLYRRQVQTYIGGYGVAQGTTLGQVASNTTTSLTTLTITLKNPTTAGDCLVCCFAFSQVTTQAAISGITLGGSADNWTSTPAGVTGTAGTIPTTAIWIDPNCKGGQTSVVITLTGGAGASAIVGYVFEVPGLFTSPLDTAPAGLSGSAGSATPQPWTSAATGVLAQSSEVAFALISWPTGNGPVSPPGSPWQEQASVGISGGLSIATAYQVVTATNSLTYSGTIANPSLWATAIITLKILPAGITIGGAQVSLSPAGYGTRWYPNQVNIATGAGPADSATAAGYLNVVGQGGFLFQSYAGGGDQIGLAVPEMLPGDTMYVVWTGSKPGISTQAVVIGAQSVLAM